MRSKHDHSRVDADALQWAKQSCMGCGGRHAMEWHGAGFAGAFSDYVERNAGGSSGKRRAYIDVPLHADIAPDAVGGTRRAVQERQGQGRVAQSLHCDCSDPPGPTLLAETNSDAPVADEPIGGKKSSGGAHVYGDPPPLPPPPPPPPPEDDPPPPPAWGKCCCKIIDMWVAVIRFDCLGIPKDLPADNQLAGKGLHHWLTSVDGIIRFAIDYELVMERGSRECSLEMWEYTDKPGGLRHMSPWDPLDEDLYEPDLDPEGKPAAEPNTWVPVGNKNMPTGTSPFGVDVYTNLNERFKQKIASDPCPSENSFWFDDTPSGLYRSMYLYQVYRAHSGCPGVKPREAQVAIWVGPSPGKCMTFPSAGDTSNSAGPWPNPTEYGLAPAYFPAPNPPRPPALAR